MNLRLKILLSVLLLTSISTAQEKFTISGYIKDKESGESLIGAKVYIDTLKTGIITNIYGFYSLTLPSGNHEILYSYTGYEPVKKGVQLDENIKLNINLSPGNLLKEVTVTAERKQHETTEIGTVNLSMDKVKSLPVLLGEVDIIKTAQLLPGIQSGSEGSSGIYVRGGGPDQNLILLDGVPIYNANHLFGFFSVFNADAINSVKIVKGGFPARYGGRLSSVIDINMKEGNMKKLHGEGSVGLISSKLMLNGPIIKDKTSFMITGRRTYIDLLAKPFIKAYNNKNGQSGSSTTGGYFFYDLNGKVNHIINDNNRVFFSAYMGNDKFNVINNSSYTDGISGLKRMEETDGGLSWGNKIMALRWNHQYSPKIFSNLTLNYSQYNFSTGFGLKDFEVGNENNPDQNFKFDYNSGITDWGGRLDFFYYPNPNHKINFGVGEIYHDFNPGVNQFNFTVFSDSINQKSSAGNVYSHEFYGFIEDDMKFGERLAANVGLHYSNFLVRKKWYNSLQPRAALNYKLDEYSSVKLSYSRTAQFLHLLSNTSIGLPTDLWVPATENIAPQYGNQISVGYARELKKGYRVSAEGYYKTMENLIEYKDGASFLSGNGNWEEQVEIGNGNSYGGEILLEKRSGKTTGWIGYTLSWTNRKFENLNEGKVYPYRYDRRHDFSVVVTHKFNDKIDVGVVWVYGTGNAVSLPLQKYTGTGENGESTLVEHIGDKNGYRMPSYHRLDAGVNIHKEKKWGEATWSFGVYNAYNRKNPFYLQFGYLKNTNEYALKQVSLFPVIPSVSYNFKF